MELLEGTLRDDRSQSELGSCCGGPFMCGGCGSYLDTACGLHTHMTTNHSDGSYHYDNVIKTAFPRYDTCCATTQTSTENTSNIILQDYLKRNTFQPPKRFRGITVKSELNNIVAKTDIDDEKLSDVPHTNMTVHNRNRQLFTPRQNITPNYNLRHTSKKIQLKENSCYVSVERMKMLDGVVCTGMTFPDCDVTLKGEPDNNSEPLMDETPDYGDVSDNTECDGVYGRGNPTHINERNTAVPSGNKHAFGSYLKKGHNLSPGIATCCATATAALSSQNSKDRLGKNVTKHIIDGPSDEKDSLWSPVVETRTTKRKQKQYLSSDNIKSTTHIVSNDTGNLCERNDREPRSNVNVQRKKKEEKKRKTDRKQFMCDTCGAVMHRCLQEAHLNKHLGFKPYICDICANSYVTEKRLKTHVEIVHDAEKGIGRYKCPECGRVYNKKYLYDIHVNSHSDARPFKCDQCIAMFKDQKYVKAHIRKVHSVPKPIYCNICGKEYFKKMSLTSHMLSVHSSPKLACKYCDRLFHLEKVRRHHELTHTGEKRYTCCVCGHGFIQWTPYLEHMMKQHGYSKPHVQQLSRNTNSPITTANDVRSSASLLPEGQTVSRESN